MQNFDELRREAEEAKERLKRDVLELHDILKRIARESGENGRVVAEESLKRAEKRIEDAVSKSEKQFERALAAVTSCYLSYDDFVTRELDFNNFANIEVDCAIRVEVTQSDKYCVSIWASQALQDYVSAVKSGHTLKLSLKSQSFSARPIVTAKITMPQINKLRLGGATNATVRGFDSKESINLNLSASSTGASRLTGKVQVADVDLVLSGASRVVLNGSAENVTLSAWGASKAEMGDLTLRDAEVNLKGASEAIINAIGKLDIDLSSGSRLTYTGNPTINTVSVTGASSLNHR
jgi:hypothetical protein